MTTMPHQPPTATQAGSRTSVADIPAFGDSPDVRSGFSLAAIVVTVMMVPLAIWGWGAFETRANALAAALADQRRVTEAVGEHTLKLLEAQAFAIDLLEREVGERDCPALRSDSRVQETMSLVGQSSQTESIWLINADGFPCMTSDPARLDARSREFREFFTGAREVPPGRYYVDRAIIGLAGSIAAFDVAKARRKGGAFNGVVLASVDLAGLVRYWRNVIGTQPTQRIALFREDGATIARSWEPLVPAADPVAERRMTMLWREAPDGSTLHESHIDGAPRAGAWHSLPDWGVVVTSTVDRDAVLAPWRQSTLIYGLVALVVSGLLGMLAWSLSRERRILARIVEERTGALRMSEQRLALFIDRAPAAIAMFDADMRYLAVSRRYLDDYGLTSYKPETLLGRSHYEVLPGIPERWRAIHRRVLAGETLSADEDWFPREDGGQDWVRWEMAPWYRRDGRPGGAVLFSEVVTARRKAEEALRESEARFRAAVRAVSGILWTNDASGEMTGEQPGWTALTGQTREEYQGHGWAKALHPEDAQPTIDAWNEAVAERKPFVFEHRVRRHDGVWRRYAIRAVPVPGDDDANREWVGVHTDITEQREAEAELAALNRHLEERVREESAAREAAQAHAAHAQRMQALGQLAGGIAHDFNNILQAVQGGAGLIERRATDPVSVRRFARTMAGAAERGAAITRRLLTFARRGDLRAERIDPAGLLEGLRDVLAQTLGSPITVRVESGSELPALTADRGQLETVLVNLATNARDAMPDGGTLTLAAAAEEAAAARVHPAGLKPGHYIRLAVTDTGTGMDRTTLERALEPFFTTKPQDKGTGLGLSIAKGFAEQSGGALAIESEPGHGATVTLWLPVADLGKEVAEARPGLALVAGLARRVLVVEDEDVVREMLVASLEDAGFAVLAAGDGAEALALLDAGEAVDALVSDLSMPGIGGLALIREAHARRPGLPAVLLTGYAGEAAHLAVSGAQPGGFSLLRKPVSVAQLVDRIEMVLAARTRVEG